MTREELIEVLADFAGPLGPFRSPDDQEKTFRESLAEATSDDLGLLLDLLSHPPPVAASRADAWDYTLEEALLAVGKLEPTRAAARMEAMLRSPAGRATVIAALGGLGEASSVHALGDLVAEEELGDNELVTLACALGELGGPAATAILETMRSRFSSRPNVISEVAIALRT